MRADVQHSPRDAEMASAKQRFKQENSNSWPVADGNQLLGVISSQQIEAATPPPSTVLDLVMSADEYPYVHLDHPLSYALDRMGAKGVDGVPVVSRANI